MIRNIPLPFETSIQIFSSLEKQDIQSFSYTSKGARALFNNYRNTRHFYIRALSNQKEIAKNFSSTAKMIEFIEDKHQFNHLKIENLNLSHFAPEISNESFMMIINHVNLVGTLTIYNVSFTALRIVADKLEDLNKLIWLPNNPHIIPLKNNQIPKITNTSNHISKMTNLRELEILDFATGITSMPEFQELPNLKKLTVEQQSYCEDLLQFTSVQVIHLKNNPKLHNRMIEPLLGKVNLRALTIENCPHITKECLDNAEYYPHVQVSILALED